jgi:photosystem II stability/assembly factor-like uncharacterized protein
MNLSLTTDAGSRWHTVYDGGPRPSTDGPFERPIVFATQEDGFAADVEALGDPVFMPTGRLFRTTDGARHWQTQLPPLADRRHCAERAAAADCVVSTPRFFGRGTAVLPGAVRDGGRTVVSFDRTADGGTTWTLRSRLTVPTLRNVDVSGCAYACPLASVASPAAWWVLSRDHRRLAVWRTVDAGRHWTKTVGPAALRRVDGFWALDAGTAFAVVEVDVSRGTARRLLATTDGGRTWRDVTPTA